MLLRLISLFEDSVFGAPGVELFGRCSQDDINREGHLPYCRCSPINSEGFHRLKLESMEDAYERRLKIECEIWEEGGCYWYLDLESHRSDVGVAGAGAATSHRNRFPTWVTVWDLCNLYLHLYGGDDGHLTNPKLSPRKAQDLRRHAPTILQIYFGLTLETPKPSLSASDLRLYDPSI
ncbi:unnamed protein product [Lactuca saligna]|uniref:Uncharacterized protein n=1 Tax=Lactuca saligna TaxID=75948 RepID=A0AA35ZUH0_LACSI|nr:unnamed protein product [Lactuca saligna]